MGYEGHVHSEREPARREEVRRAAIELLLEAVSAVRAAGLPVEVVSAAGTNTCEGTARSGGVTEVQAGSYVFMDVMHSDFVSGYEFALTILSTVISRHDGTVVLDAGRKTSGADIAAPLVVGHDATLRYEAEEHSVLDVPPDCTLAVGDVVELVPGYAPVTANLHEAFHVVENDVVVDVWRILARGAGRS
jgi:D-serine deaminase-like pyridoxal phosphate-dependent protein